MTNQPISNSKEEVAFKLMEKITKIMNNKRNKALKGSEILSVYTYCYYATQGKFLDKENEKYLDNLENPENENIRQNTLGL